MRIWSLFVLVACGSGAAPPATTPPTTPPPPPAAPVTCGDVGVMLRGEVKDPKKAGPAKEAAIASACLFDKWSRDVLDCVGSQPARQACLAKLTEAQRVALAKKLNTWAEAYGDATAPTDSPPEPEVDP
jgi:hypothetical protein